MTDTCVLALSRRLSNEEYDELFVGKDRRQFRAVFTYTSVDGMPGLRTSLPARQAAVQANDALAKFDGVQVLTPDNETEAAGNRSEGE